MTLNRERSVAEVDEPAAVAGYLGVVTLIDGPRVDDMKDVECSEDIRASFQTSNWGHYSCRESQCMMFKRNRRLSFPGTFIPILISSRRPVGSVIRTT